MPLSRDGEGENSKEVEMPCSRNSQGDAPGRLVMISVTVIMVCGHVRELKRKVNEFNQDLGCACTLELCLLLAPSCS